LPVRDDLFRKRGGYRVRESMKIKLHKGSLSICLTVGRVIVLAWMALASPAAAQTPDINACGIITLEDAEALVGGPLQVIERPKIKSANGEDAYDSICTYIPAGARIDAGPSVDRTLDLTLHVVSSPQEAGDLLTRSFIRYRRLVASRNFPYPDSSVALIEDFGQGAFVMEAVTDTKTGYKSALIAFAKGRIGGTIGAWNKPNSSLETSKAALRHILNKLP
jgi:hypothetical protein